MPTQSFGGGPRVGSLVCVRLYFLGSLYHEVPEFKSAGEYLWMLGFWLTGLSDEVSAEMVEMFESHCDPNLDYSDQATFCASPCRGKPSAIGGSSGGIPRPHPPLFSADYV